MLKVISLCVAYGNIRALSDVSIEVTSGEITALIGPNGAGKTSVIRAVSGVIPIQSGEVLIGEKEIKHCTISERARLMGVVPQARQLGGAYSVRQAVMMGRTANMGWLGREQEEDIHMVEQALAQTHLLGLAERQIAQLSGGEQQRVLLARALAQNTPVLLLDEPTNHLDLQHQADFLGLLRRLAKERGLAVLAAMHDLNLVAATADNAILLVGGKVFASGTPNRVLTKENIEKAYQTDVRIVSSPEGEMKVILPRITE